MNTFYDWKEVLAMKGLREATLAYAMSDAPECLEDGPDGVKELSDDAGRTRGRAEQGVRSLL